MPHVPLKKHPRHFISSAGYVFKIENEKEVIIPNRQSKKTKKLFVYIEGKHYELIYLMIEHFDIKYKPTDCLKYSISKDLTIDISSIRIKPFMDKFGLSKQEESMLYKYKCDHKANGANARTIDKISPLQVFTTLKLHDFKCVYCGGGLLPENWHLDHFASLSKGGKNIFENIVPACSTCNIMKGALEGHQFHSRCIKIAKNFAFANDCDPQRKAVIEKLRAA
jgi:hypothetical protein